MANWDGTDGQPLGDDGELRPSPRSHNRGWPAGRLTDTKPGAVYLHSASDAKKLAWNDAAKLPPPLDRVIIFAKRRERGGGWFIARAIWDSRGHNWVDPDAPDVRYSAAFVTHWHEDTLGTP